MRSNVAIGKKLTEIQNAQHCGHWKKIPKNSKCAAMWLLEKKNDKNEKCAAMCPLRKKNQKN